MLTAMSCVRPKLLQPGSACNLQVLVYTFLLTSSLVLASWIDIETPLEKRTITSLIDGTTYHLVMSDEFNVPNRTFKDGHDTMWTAMDKSDDDASSAGGGSMQFYNSSAVTTGDGYLKIKTFLQKTEWNRYDHVKKTWRHEIRNFTSGMIQSWNKFCFTGGIVEIDIVFPGDPSIGGLWPAVWMLGNLGRATYEASTNMIWPWSYDKCDRKLQPPQAISACNKENHYGMNPYQGRGATEIDIVEVMYGNSNGPLPSTDPPVELPYADFTLQLAPGVPKNRPQSGNLPLRKDTITPNGHLQLIAQSWYDGLEMHGNTSINPFFYGTYLAETKPYEPVSRNKDQAYQADAVGVAHQLTDAHFRRPHTFRLEWQPGPGGRLDWFVKTHRLNETFYMEGDGDGQDWTLAYSIKDESLRNLMGSQIPNEPSYMILNVAISSTWGFPYDVPDWCPKCYDCNDPRCACSFYPGFCEMIEAGDVTMLVDSIRVYQSADHTAHVGTEHTLGCDPPAFPTKDWIDGHAYRYGRNPPFSYEDFTYLRKIQLGGGSCARDSDCGGNLSTKNLTAISMLQDQTRRAMPEGDASPKGHGQCVQRLSKGMFSSLSSPGKVCQCKEGYTGPHCLALAHFDESPSASELRRRHSPFKTISKFKIPGFMLGVLVLLIVLLLSQLTLMVIEEKRAKQRKPFSAKYKGLVYPINSNTTVVTGASI